jgi:kumamolisin
VPPCINDGVSVGPGVPDVAADADPHTGLQGRRPRSLDGGRRASAVDPLYAGLFAPINQSFGFSLGFITHLLRPL